MSAEDRFASGDSSDASAFPGPRVAVPPRAQPEPDQGAAPGPDDNAPEDNAPEEKGPEDKGPAAFQRLRDEVQELRAHLALLWAAKIDSIKLSVRRLMLTVALGFLALLILATYLIASTALVIVGIGGGLGRLFGQLWLGHLTAGLILLSTLALAIYLALRRWTRTSRERTVQKYARRRRPPSARSERGDDKPDSREHARV